MKPFRPVRAALSVTLVAIVAATCAPSLWTQGRTLATQWVERNSYAEVLTLAMHNEGPTLFSRAEFAKALASPASKHSTNEREIALAALLDRTPPEQAPLVLSSALEKARISTQWALIFSAMHLINRTPAAHDDPEVRAFAAGVLHDIAETIVNEPLPPDAVSAALAAIEAAERLDGPSPAESLRVIAQHSDNASIVSRARAVARELLRSDGPR